MKVYTIFYVHYDYHLFYNYIGLTTDENKIEKIINRYNKRHDTTCSTDYIFYKIHDLPTGEPVITPETPNNKVIVHIEYLK